MDFKKEGRGKVFQRNNDCTKEVTQTLYILIAINSIGNRPTATFPNITVLQAAGKVHTRLHARVKNTDSKIYLTVTACHTALTVLSIKVKDFQNLQNKIKSSHRRFLIFRAQKRFPLTSPVLHLFA